MEGNRSRAALKAELKEFSNFLTDEKQVSLRITQ